MNRMTIMLGLVIIAAIALFSLPERPTVVREEHAPPTTTTAAEDSVPEPPQAPPPPAGNDLAVVGVYPPGEDAPDDELVLYFNEPLAPISDPQQDADAFLVTDPPVSGHVHIEDTWLRFSAPSLSEAFAVPQVMSIDVVLQETLRSVSNQTVPPDMRRLTFAAPPPEIEQVKMKSGDGDSIRTHISFSRVADLRTLSHLLTVRDRRQHTVSASVEPADDGVSAVLTFPHTTEPPITITIKEGLPWGTYFQHVADEMTVSFPDADKLQVENVFVNWNQTPHTLFLQFSHNVLLNELPAFVTVQPPDSDTDIPLPPMAPSIPADAAANNAAFLLPDTPEVRDLDQLVVTVSPWLFSSDRTHCVGQPAVHRMSRTDPHDRSRPRRRPELFTLRFHHWDTDITHGLRLQMSFSRAIRTEHLEEHIEISPPVALDFSENAVRSSRISVRGDFQSNVEYTLRIAAGLCDDDGNVLVSEDLSYGLNRTPLREGAAFDMPNLYYFPRRDMAPPKLHARNITEATVTLSEVFPSNLPVFVRDFSQSGVNRRMIAEYTRDVADATVSFPDMPDTLLSSKVSIDALLPTDSRGVFLMRVNPMYDHQNNCRLLLYTDLGALTHWTTDGLTIFVHDLFSLQPQPNARVSVYSDKFQEIGVSHTDKDGIARFSSFNPGMGAPALAVMETDTDYSFIDLRQPQQTQTPFTAAMPHYDRDGYDAFLYFDRELYRPGEPVHIRWIVRIRYVDAVADVPLQLRIANPQGRWIHEEPVTPSSFGTGGMRFQTEQVYPTGRYRVELRVPGSRTLVGSATFSLEEFVPNRMRAEIALEHETVNAGDTTEITVNAEHLFGGAASRRKAEARVYLAPTDYESKGWPGYRFGNEDTIADHLVPLGEEMTDDDGTAVFSFAFDPPADATMPLEATVNARVFEVGGRAVSETASFTAFPHDLLLGIATTAHDATEMLEVHVAAITTDDAPADLDTAHVTLEREEWHFHVRGFQERRQTRWERSFEEVQTYDVSLSEGKGTLEIPYPQHGVYRLRVHSPETPMYSMLLFNRWWNRLFISSKERADLVRLTVDKDLYEAGDTVNLHIESPYDGNAYVVVQGETILDQLVIPVEGGEAHAQFIVPREWFPNAWIQATVVRDTSEQAGAQYPYSSFGMVNVPLDLPERRLDVALLDVPEEIRPEEPFTVRVETRDHDNAPVQAEVTIAAVDEGIHSILGYDNPDPYGWFQRTRRFGQNRAHYYDNVFFDRDTPPIGGDTMRRLGLASQVGESWIRPVALWSGAVQTDENGLAEVTFDVPAFIGQLRLVAVAATERATGATADSVYVRRPYILRTGMPRFALPGDQFQCAATLRNMTDTPVTATLRWSATEALSGAGQKQLELRPHDEASWTIPIVAGSAPGQGMITWETVVKDDSGTVLDTLREEAPIPVNTPAAYQTKTDLIVLEPGETRRIENTHFVEESSLHTAINVSGIPAARLYPGLRYLLRFPYGCVEQVVSRAMPLYMMRHYAELYQDILPTDQTLDVSVVDTYIRQAIDQLLTMQTQDGGLGSWPGANSSYPYGSVYALHFLTLIRREHAYTVYESAFEELQDYVMDILKSEHVYSKTPSLVYLRAYACYVLALDGSLEAIEYIPRFDHIPVPLSGRYLLAAAKAMHTGEPLDLEAWLEGKPIADMDERIPSGILHSSIRADAVKLLALAQMDAPPESMYALAGRLFNYLEDTHRFTTQDAAFVVSALGMYLEKFVETGPDAISARIVVNDDTHTLDGFDIFEDTLLGTPPQYEVTNTGALPVYINLEMSGLPLQPRMKPVAEGLDIERHYRLQTGEPVSDNVFQQGEQYIVTLHITPKEPLENLLVVDLLPAGFEIANPRLEPEIQFDADNDTEEAVIFTPAHLEVRDDRIAFAVDRLDNKPHMFHYLVRTVTPGTFQLPALHAECMYQPAVQAATMPGEITVR